jgi:hypothetical protein
MLKCICFDKRLLTCWRMEWRLHVPKDRFHSAVPMKDGGEEMSVQVYPTAIPAVSASCTILCNVLSDTVAK